MKSQALEALRDAALVFVGAVLLGVVKSKHGAIELDWQDWKAILDAGIVSFAWCLLTWLTPLTRRYGVGADAVPSVVRSPAGSGL